MVLRRLVLLFALLLLTSGSAAQSVLFDFDSAPLHSPLPIDLTVGGITARFSATGQGFSIQEANTMGFTPTGFSGYCIYPSSVFAADLLVSFSTPLNSFSILYAPEEYACDSSATLRVTAYSGSTFVDTATMTAPVPGTWPTATLVITNSVPFDNVVVHYDSPPPTGGDWGPIFMADNMSVTPAPPPSCSPYPSALFCDDFGDGILDPSWIVSKPAWAEAGGVLTGSPTGRKAIINNSFAGCQVCYKETRMTIQANPDARVWMYSWYLDKKNTMELLIKPASNKVVLRQRGNGMIVAKAGGLVTMTPGVPITFRLTYDGTKFTVTADGNPALTLTPVGTVPAGTFGFALKNTSAALDYITVNQ